MRNLTFILFILLFTAAPSQSEEDTERALREINSLEVELVSIKRESADIPEEELDKASKWTQDAKRQFNSGNADQGRITLEKASFQIEFLRTLIEESKSKKEIDELNEILGGIRNQIEEIKKVNAEVSQEINRLEQK
jgi:hypothetical protein